jgi:hypothetical protein
MFPYSGGCLLSLPAAAGESIRSVSRNFRYPISARSLPVNCYNVIVFDAS